jgi:hypothetical protein
MLGSRSREGALHMRFRSSPPAATRLHEIPFAHVKHIISKEASVQQAQSVEITGGVQLAAGCEQRQAHASNIELSNCVQWAKAMVKALEDHYPGKLTSITSVISS